MHMPIGVAGQEKRYNFDHSTSRATPDTQGHHELAQGTPRSPSKTSETTDRNLLQAWTHKHGLQKALFRFARAAQFLKSSSFIDFVQCGTLTSENFLFSIFFFSIYFCTINILEL